MSVARLSRGSVAVMLCLSACGAHQASDDDSAHGGAGGGVLADPTPSKRQQPITGGTLSIVSQGRLAIAADPDRDLVTIVRLADASWVRVVTLPGGSHPTRSMQDGAGNIEVLLRGTGQLATIDPSNGHLLGTDSICPDPRGLTWDATNQRTLIACAGGELVSRPLNGSGTVVTYPGGELRDVFSDSQGVSVTTFRQPTLSTLGPDGTKITTVGPPNVAIGSYHGAPVAFEPNTAWRTLPSFDGFVMVHQWAVNADVRSTTELAGPAFTTTTTTTLEPIVVPDTPYYGGYIAGYNTVTHTTETQVCSTGVVRSAVTLFGRDGEVKGSHEVVGILPVDAAISPDGSQLAVAMAGNHVVTRVPLTELTSIAGSACGPVQPAAPNGTGEDPIGQVVGVAFTPAGTLIAQSRQPSRLVILNADNTVKRTIALAGTPSSTPGFDLFHTAARAVACASCHPEAGEDGHTWNFFGRLHRTQTLGGGIASTAPYHWAGDLPTMAALMGDTFVGRMGGTLPSSRVIDDLTAFLNAQPARNAPLAARIDPAAVEKGKVVFQSAACTSCHSGEHLTDNQSVDVGTGGAFQVPSLIGVAARAPYMHSGCAATLEERFTNATCGGGLSHGSASTLSSEDLSALISYLKTL